ncbi:MAG: hypothetical protein M1820_007949 [Bogoriella megaspora]|nr:MAG: hypothetical protein M1820_007949 [Bogoriella megaspora]
MNRPVLTAADLERKGVIALAFPRKAFLKRLNGARSYAVSKDDVYDTQGYKKFPTDQTIDIVPLYLSDSEAFSTCGSSRDDTVIVRPIHEKDQDSQAVKSGSGQAITTKVFRPAKSSYCRLFPCRQYDFPGLALISTTGTPIYLRRKAADGSPVTHDIREIEARNFEWLDYDETWEIDFSHKQPWTDRQWDHEGTTFKPDIELRAFRPWVSHNMLYGPIPEPRFKVVDFNKFYEHTCALSYGQIIRAPPNQDESYYEIRVQKVMQQRPSTRLVRVHHSGLGKSVVAKTLLLFPVEGTNEFNYPGYHRYLAKFIHEVEMMQKLEELDSPSVCKLVGADIRSLTMYLEFFPGESLSNFRDEHGMCTLASDAVLHIASTVTETMARIHDLGYVHNDIKPENIMYEETTGRVMVIDFGLMALESAVINTGTAHYLPRSYLSWRERGKHSDVFGWGLTHLWMNGAIRLPGLVKKKSSNVQPWSIGGIWSERRPNEHTEKMRNWLDFVEDRCASVPVSNPYYRIFQGALSPCPKLWLSFWEMNDLLIGRPASIDRSNTVKALTAVAKQTAVAGYIKWDGGSTTEEDYTSDF